jgi:hypothetical protein
MAGEAAKLGADVHGQACEAMVGITQMGTHLISAYKQRGVQGIISLATGRE